MSFNALYLSTLYHPPPWLTFLEAATVKFTPFCSTVGTIACAKRRGRSVSFLSPSPQISNPRLEARGTTLFLPPSLIIFGGRPDEKKTRRGARRDIPSPSASSVFRHGSSERPATPPVLLSFSCSVRTEWGRGGVRVAVRG